MSAGPQPARRHLPLRLAEILGALSLATDLGTGQPMGHAIRTCLLAVGIAQELGLGDDDTRTIHQVALLRFVGCTADAAETAVMAGGDDLDFNRAMALTLGGTSTEMAGRMMRTVGRGLGVFRRTGLVVSALTDFDGARVSLSAHCEVASTLASRLGLDEAVITALSHAYERWDGAGYPASLRGEEVPLAIQVVAVVRDVDLLSAVEVDPLEILQRRRGRGYAPKVVDAAGAVSLHLLDRIKSQDNWEAMLAAEPFPPRMIGGDLQAVLEVFADFTDLKSGWMRGHSRAVADLAASAAEYAGLGEESRHLRWAALVHDIGRVGVSNGVWDKPVAVSTEEKEAIRLHSYLTDRILSRCPALAPLAWAASSHHERLDGSGYHRAAGGSQLTLGDQILAAADMWSALLSARPHRPPLERSSAIRVLKEEAEDGRLHREAVAAVLSAAGEPPSGTRLAWPAGLTEREVEVLRLIARGLGNRKVAEQLHISVKTVGRHVENIYQKIGANSRAGAAVFAMGHELLDR